MIIKVIDSGYTSTPYLAYLFKNKINFFIWRPIEINGVRIVESGETPEDAINNVKCEYFKQMNKKIAKKLNKFSKIIKWNPNELLKEDAHAILQSRKS